MRGLLQKAPGLPSHPCPRRGGDERQLAPGELLPSPGRVRAGRVGKSQGGRGYLWAGGGAAIAGLRGPAAAFGSRPRAEGGPGQGTGSQLRAIASSRESGSLSLLGQSRDGRRCDRRR